jgi:hypothetical protein
MKHALFAGLLKTERFVLLKGITGLKRNLEIFADR